ncbi:MAG: hypothetical protein JW958_14650 [Candidatus Eisenbacteria bacterium]|nr:hypothetical protein [Candidatus Eisenbacteria bacterium]
MLTRKYRHAWTILFVLPLALFLFGCGGGTDPEENDDHDYGCTPEADSILVLANAELESVLYEQFNRAGEIEHPSEVDFTNAYDLYMDALVAAPDCPTANFGAAVTSLLLLSTDAAVGDAFDEWQDYLDENIPFSVESTGKRPLGIPITLSSGRDALSLPFDVVPLTSLAIARRTMKAMEDSVPGIADVQDLLETTVLPQVEDAIGYLDEVASERDFQFIVSGKMQGDQEEENAEIDRTDVLALRSGCHLLAAAIRVAAAYNLELDAYDSLTLHQAIQPGSGWLTLKNGGAAKMQDAYDRLFDSVDDLDSAIVSLLAEEDDQRDDIIKIGPDNYSYREDIEIERSDVDSIRYNLENFRNAMRNGYVRTDDWDSDSATADEPLTLHFEPIFTSPVQDWKALLPAYTGTIVRWPWETHDTDYNENTTTTVIVPSSGNYGAYVNLAIHRGDAEYEIDGYGTSFIAQALQDILADELTQVQAEPSWAGYFYGYASYYGDLAAGSRPIQVSMNIYYDYADSWVYIPVITWEAETFDEWSWPDPTMNGLLPDMTSTEDLWDIFGITESRWERRWDLDWTEGNWDWDLEEWLDNGGAGSSGPTPPAGWEQ